MCLNSYYYYYYIIEAQLTPIIHQYFKLRNHKQCRNLHPTLANLPNTSQQPRPVFTLIYAQSSSILSNHYNLQHNSALDSFSYRNLPTISLWRAHHSIHIYSCTHRSVICTFLFGPFSFPPSGSSVTCFRIYAPSSHCL